MKNSKRNQNQKGFSLIELLVVIAIILIIAAIAIPNLLQARVAANEASAVSSLHAIHVAMVTYTDNYPMVGFAPTVASLGSNGTDCSAPDQTQACLIDNLLSTGSKSGYSFTATGVGAAPAGQYFSTAIPVNGNGNRSFCNTEMGEVHFDANGGPIADHDTCIALPSLQ